MIISVTISDQPGRCELGKMPIIDSLSVNGKSLLVIYNYLKVVEGKEWLDRATDEAAKEMVSDVDDAIREAKEAIKSARKQIPLVHKYFLNPVKFWLLKLK